jgi:hypothetical protein
LVDSGADRLDTKKRNLRSFRESLPVPWSRHHFATSASDIPAASCGGRKFGMGMVICLSKRKVCGLGAAGFEISRSWLMTFTSTLDAAKARLLFQDLSPVRCVRSFAFDATQVPQTFFAGSSPLSNMW